MCFLKGILEPGKGVMDLGHLPSGRTAAACRVSWTPLMRREGGQGWVEQGWPWCPLLGQV